MQYLTQALTPMRATRSCGASPAISASDICPSPLPSQETQIKDGAFIAYSLDTQYIADAYRDQLSPDSYRALLAVPVRRYLGLVTWVCVLDDTDELVVNYVSRRKPPVLDDLCMPISPTEGRVSTALEPSPQPPFEDLVVWTTCGTRFRVTHLHDTDDYAHLQDSLNSIVLEQDDRVQLEEQIAVDIAQIDALSPVDVPEKPQLLALKPPEPGQNIPVQVWRNIHLAGDLELEDPLYMIEEVKMVTRYVISLSCYYN